MKTGQNHNRRGASGRNPVHLWKERQMRDWCGPACAALALCGKTAGRPSTAHLRVCPSALLRV